MSESQHDSGSPIVPAVEPESESEFERAGRGRFAKGNKGGPGRPKCDWFQSLDMPEPLRQQLLSSFAVRYDGYYKRYKGKARYVCGKTIPPDQVEATWDKRRADLDSISVTPESTTIAVAKTDSSKKKGIAKCIKKTDPEPTAMVMHETPPSGLSRPVRYAPIDQIQASMYIPDAGGILSMGTTLCAIRIESLSVRTRNVLARNGINLPQELSVIPYDQVLQWRGAGEIVRNELKEWLASYGLRFSWNPPLRNVARRSDFSPKPEAE